MGYPAAVVRKKRGCVQKRACTTRWRTKVLRQARFACPRARVWPSSAGPTTPRVPQRGFCDLTMSPLIAACPSRLPALAWVTSAHRVHEEPRAAGFRAVRGSSRKQQTAALGALTALGGGDGWYGTHVPRLFCAGVARGARDGHLTCRASIDRNHRPKQRAFFASRRTDARPGT